MKGTLKLNLEPELNSSYDVGWDIKWNVWKMDKSPLEMLKEKLDLKIAEKVKRTRSAIKFDPQYNVISYEADYESEKTFDPVSLVIVIIKAIAKAIVKLIKVIIKILETIIRILKKLIVKIFNTLGKISREMFGWIRGNWEKVSKGESDLVGIGGDLKEFFEEEEDKKESEIEETEKRMNLSFWLPILGAVVLGSVLFLRKL